MPYYIVSGQPVFLHSRLHKELEDQALKDWSGLDRIGARIAGPKADEAQSLVAELLEENSVLEEFYSDYVFFDLTGEEAEVNVWDLLYDFCHLRQCGHLVDVRSFEDKIISDYGGEGYAYPMGRLFEIHVPVEPIRQDKSIFKRTPKSRHAVRILIDTSKVTRLHGDLNDFTVSMGSQVMQFDENGIELLPPEWKTETVPIDESGPR